MTAVRPAAQTVLFQMPIEAMIDRLPPRHDGGVTRRVSATSHISLVFRQGEARGLTDGPPFCAAYEPWHRHSGAEHHKRQSGETLKGPPAPERTSSAHDFRTSASDPTFESGRRGTTAPRRRTKWWPRPDNASLVLVRTDFPWSRRYHQFETSVFT
jgi:hypothetical protein